MSDSKYRGQQRDAANGSLSSKQRLLQERLRSGEDRKTFVLVPDEYNPVSSYAGNLSLLRDTCKNNLDGYLQPDFRGVARPLSFRETLEARVNLFRNGCSDSEKMRLFKCWNDTCTAVVYKGGSSKFKIVPVSEHLLGLEENFDRPCIDVDYDAPVFDNFEELDGKSPLYNTCGLSKGAVLEHPGWLAAVEGDEDLLAEFADVVFHDLKERYDLDKGMGFWLAKRRKGSHLWQLTVGDIVGSDARHKSLHRMAFFVRVAQTPL